MANLKLATTDYVDGEVAKKQEYFADVSADEASGNRELSLKDANSNVVGQIIAQKEGGVLFKDVATPAEATDGANKGYADNNFANALKGTASGVSVRLDDASPIEHTLGVKVRGKNLFDVSQLKISNNAKGLTTTQNSFSFKNTVKSQTSCVEFAIYLQVGTYYIKGDVALSDGLNGGWSLGRGDTYLINNSSRGTVNGTITITEAREYKLLFYCSYNSEAGTTATYSNIQLELGSTATTYAPFISDLTSVIVTRCGKNLIQFPYIPLTTEKTVAGITYTPLSDGGIKLNGTATAISSVVFYNNTSQGAVPITLKANLTYMASTGLSSKIGVYIRPFKPSGNSHVAITDVFTTRTITLTEDATVDQILVVVASGTTVNNIVIYPQIELSPTATGYEPYNGQTYTPTADGTVENVKSIYPTTTLTTGTSGVVISTEYNKDINKAFAELQQAILSMGGNT